jgi:hypothetical protein
MKILMLVLIHFLAGCALWSYLLPVAPPGRTAPDCTSVYPLSRIQEIQLGQTTTIQLQAAFGQPINRSGRPPRLRFENQDCIMLITLSGDNASEIELLDYGTLDLLLETYGTPAVVGIAEGNLTLPLADTTIALYPDQGVIAMFEVTPDKLGPRTPISSLTIRTPYDLVRQITRLNITPVEWQLSPSVQD